jgi:hypothetical protein
MAVTEQIVLFAAPFVKIVQRIKSTVRTVTTSLSPAGDRALLFILRLARPRRCGFGSNAPIGGGTRRGIRVQPGNWRLANLG